MQKIPILDNVRATISYTYSEMNAIFRIGLPWVVLYAAFTLVFQLIGIGEYLDLTKAVAFVRDFPADARAMGYEKLPILEAKLTVITESLGIMVQVHDVLDKLLRVVAYASAAVGVYRYYLFDLDVPKLHFTFGLLELKSSIIWIVILCLVFGIGILLMNVLGFNELDGVRLGALYIVFGLAVLFVFARFIMIFPALAVDNVMGLKATWLATRGNWWNLFSGLWLVMMSSLPLFILKTTVSKIALPISIIWPGQMMVSMVILALIFWFMASSYKFLVEGKTTHIIPI